MATVQQVYDAALAIMHEAADESYAQRTVPLINTLIGQCWQMSAEYDTGRRDMWRPVEALTDEIIGIDNHIALSVMPFGLAALLYIDEDDARSDSWWAIYQETLVDARRSPAAFGEIEDVYGCYDLTDGGRW